MSLFKIAELMNMAVEDEKSGEVFYTEIAKKTKNAKLKHDFEEIAGQERRHADEFTKLRDNCETFAKREEYPGQYDNYLGALLSSRAFPDVKHAAEMAKNSPNDGEAIKMATDMEKHTLLFYYEMQNFISEPDSGLIKKIMDEEKEHITRLTEMTR